MTVKLIVGGYYKLSDGRNVGPATTWIEPSAVDHYFELPVTSRTGNKETIFRPDGTTEYADFHVVKEVPSPTPVIPEPAPPFVVAGAFYKTAGGVIVGPMVGPDDYSCFTSDGKELYAIRHDGTELGFQQRWDDNGIVVAEGPCEKGHRLVERVDGKEEAGSEKKEELTMKIDIAEGGFVDAFRLATDEFVRQLNAAQESIAERDKEIKRLKNGLEYMQKNRDEWYNAWLRVNDEKLRGDNRLRLARSRYKVERNNVSIYLAHIHDLEVKVVDAESKLKRNTVKAVLEHVFAAGLIIVSVAVGAVFFA